MPLPSFFSSTARPCQWIVVSSPRRLASVTSTMSSLRAISSGLIV